MKKTVCLLAMILALVFMALSLASCSGDVDPANITEDQWCEILGNLNNYTCVTTNTHEYDGKVETSKFITYATPDMIYNKVIEKSETMSEDGWQVAIGDNMYTLNVDYTDTLKENKIAFASRMQYVYIEQIGFENLRETFAKVTYDEEKKAYVYTDTYTIGSLEYKVYCEYYFENGTLSRVVGTDEWSGVKNTYERVYSDIGKTSIDNKYKVVLLDKWDKIDVEGHDFVIEDSECTPAEGCEGIGTAVYHCSHCDETLTYEYINGHKATPTIDNGSVGYKCSKCDQAVNGLLLGSQVTID